MVHQRIAAWLFATTLLVCVVAGPLQEERNNAALLEKLLSNKRDWEYNLQEADFMDNTERHAGEEDFLAKKREDLWNLAVKRFDDRRG